MKELKTFREEMRLSQPDMAFKLGISLSYYSKIEQGYKNPSYNFIKEFKKAFPHVDANIFFGVR